MKKILCALVCVLALTACGSAGNSSEVQTVTETSAATETEAAAETEAVSETEAIPEQNNDTENAPPAEERRESKGDFIRVTAVDGDVITGEKMSGGRGFGGGRDEDGTPPEGRDFSEDGEMREKGGRDNGGEPPAMSEDGDMPEKGDKNPGGERPQGETVTFTVTDSTVMDIESISVGDMISVELNEDGTAASVKAADFAKEARDSETT